MKLADHLDMPLPTYKRGCSFKGWTDTLDEKDQLAVEQMLQNPAYPISYLTNLFAQYGCPVRNSRIQAHRKRECQACYSEA